MVGNIMMMYKFEGSDNDEGFTVNWQSVTADTVVEVRDDEHVICLGVTETSANAESMQVLVLSISLTGKLYERAYAGLTKFFKVYRIVLDQTIVTRLGNRFFIWTVLLGTLRVVWTLDRLHPVSQKSLVILPPVTAPIPQTDGQVIYRQLPAGIYMYLNCTVSSWLDVVLTMVEVWQNLAFISQHCANECNNVITKTSLYAKSLTIYPPSIALL